MPPAMVQKFYDNSVRSHGVTLNDFYTFSLEKTLLKPLQLLLCYEYPETFNQNLQSHPSVQSHPE